MSVTGKVEMKPIGVVRTEAIGEGVKDRSNISKLILQEGLTEALDGIGDFSHLFVARARGFKVKYKRRKLGLGHPLRSLKREIKKSWLALFQLLDPLL